MDEVEMKEIKRQIHEIEKERLRLANKRNELQKSIEEEQWAKIREQRSQMIGNFYAIKPYERCEKVKGLVAFKALRFEPDDNEGYYIRCLCIIKNDAYSQGEVAISNRIISLFSTDRASMSGIGRKTIDKFVEINEEQFKVLLDETVESIEKYFD